jgi:hypothetical protein
MQLIFCVLRQLQVIHQQANICSLCKQFPCKFRMKLKITKLKILFNKDLKKNSYKWKVQMKTTVEDIKFKKIIQAISTNKEIQLMKIPMFISRDFLIKLKTQTSNNFSKDGATSRRYK